MPPVSPASRISGSRSPSCFTIWPALVQEGWPGRFALVPVTGPPAASISAVGTWEFGPAQSHAPGIAGDFQRQAMRGFDDQRQRAGPEFVARESESVRHIAHQRDRLLDGIDQDRQRSRFRAALGAKHASMAARLNGSAERP